MFERTADIEAKLGLKDIIVPDKFTDCNTVLLDGEEIGSKATAFWWGWRRSLDATSLYLLFLPYVKHSTILLFRDLYKSNKSIIFILLFLFIILLVVDTLLIVRAYLVRL